MIVIKILIDYRFFLLHRRQKNNRKHTDWRIVV